MVQRVAQLFGVVVLLVGVLGFVTTGMNMDASMDTAPKLLGLFPVNALHNVVHVLFGVWGLLAARTAAGALSYAKVGGAIYLILAICGYFIPTFFGLIPIGGNDVWLHALLGVVLLVVGLQAGRKTVPA
ncbi:MAG TPA: DUF4383 domain-containing protein [Gemmatimonadaceae bacterium]|jgi:hypothetical protein|nr:DUF4383 domain-containing protein [Gemmatimonadaceae bacterium]